MQVTAARRLRQKLLTASVVLLISQGAISDDCEWNSTIISLRDMPVENVTLYEQFTKLLSVKLKNDLELLADDSQAGERLDVQFSHIPRLKDTSGHRNELIPEISGDNDIAENYLMDTGALQLYVFRAIDAERQVVLSSSEVAVNTKVFLGEFRGENVRDEFEVMTGEISAENAANMTDQFSALLALSLLNRNGSGGSCTLDESRAKVQIGYWLANLPGEQQPIRAKIERAMNYDDD